MHISFCKVTSKQWRSLMSMQRHWRGQMKPCGTDKPIMTAKRQHTRSVLLECLLLAHGLVKLGLRLVKLGLYHRHALLCVVLLPACCVLTFSSVT